MKDFDWNDLRYFLTLAEAKRLAEAARLAGCSDTSMFRRVRALEDALGSQLFVRRRDGHRLTAAGEMLLPLAREAQGTMATIRRAVADGDRRADASVRVATTEFGANWILLPALGERPDSLDRLRLEIECTPDSTDLLADERTIALRFHRPTTGDHVVRKVGRVTLGLYAREATPFADGLPYLGWTKEFQAIAAARWLRGLFGPRPPVLRLATLVGHLAAARDGLGCAVLPDLAARGTGLVRLDAPAAPTLDAWLVVPRQTRAVAAIRAAAAFVRDACWRGCPIPR